MNNYFFSLILFLTIILMGFGIQFPILNYQAYACLFGILILNFGSNATLKKWLENKVFGYLGKISYGLYIYHPLAIVLVLYFCTKINQVTDILLYPLSVVLTVIIAGFSYRYFETPFLNLKGKFSRILSGDDKIPASTPEGPVVVINPKGQS